MDSGLRESSRPSERVSRLKKRAKQADGMTLRRLEAIFSGLADDTRLRILLLLAKEELCACEIMAALDLTQPSASHHLGILQRSGLVASQREGKWVFYGIADAKVEDLLTRGSQLVGGSTG